MSWGGEDEMFANDGGGSLGGIFQGNAQGNAPASFSYQPQQQPSGGGGGGGDATDAVIHHTDVALHRYNAGSKSYDDIGSAGAAIIGSRKGRKCNLVLYLPGEDTKRMCDTRIGPDMKFTVQSDVYANLYDSTGQSWSLNFASNEETLLFARYVALAKAFSMGDTALVKQDLLANRKDGPACSLGDSGTVQYTGWLVTPEGKIGDRFDTNLLDEKKLKIRVGASPLCPGFDDGLVGMRKGGKRIIVVPPHLGYGAVGTDKVPPNTMLIYEVNLSKLKPGTGPPPERAAPQPVQPVGPPKGAPVVQPQQLSEQDLAAREAEKLRERMAQLGGGMQQPQQPQPGYGQQPPQQGYSASGYQQQGGAPQGHHQGMSMALALPGQPGQPQPPQQYDQYGNPIPQYQYPYNAMQPVQPAPPSNPPPSAQPSTPKDDATIMSVLIDHQKAQGEMKAMLAKVQSSIGELGVKVEHIDPLKDISRTENKMPGLILLQNIQRLVMDNDTLMKENFDKSARIDALTDKVQKLLNKNERFIDDSNRMIEDRNDALKQQGEDARQQLKTLRAEKAQMENQLADALAQASEDKRSMLKYKSEREEMRSEVDQLKIDLEKAKEEIASLKLADRENEAKIETLTRAGKEERYGRKAALQKVEQLTEDLEEERRMRAKAEASLDDRKAKFASELKRVEALFDDEKARLEEETDTLRETLRQERLASGAIANDTIARIEKEQEEKWTAALRQQEISIRNEALVKAQNERREYEQGAYERGREDALKDKARAVEDAYRAGERAGMGKGGVGGNDNEVVRRLEKKVRKVRAEAKEKSHQKVKEIMNDVFFRLRDEFEEDETYESEDVLDTIKDTIKQATIEMLENDASDEEEESSEMSSLSSEEDEAPRKKAKGKGKAKGKSKSKEKSKSKSKKATPPPESSEEDAKEASDGSASEKSDAENSGAPVPAPVPAPKEESDDVAPPPKEDSDDVAPPKEDSDDVAPPPKEDSDDVAPPPKEDSDDVAPPAKEESDGPFASKEKSDDAPPPAKEESEDDAPPRVEKVSTGPPLPDAQAAPPSDDDEPSSLSSLAKEDDVAADVEEDDEVDARAGANEDVDGEEDATPAVDDKEEDEEEAAAAVEEEEKDEVAEEERAAPAEVTPATEDAGEEDGAEEGTKKKRRRKKDKGGAAAGAALFGDGADDPFAPAADPFGAADDPFADPMDGGGKKKKRDKKAKDDAGAGGGSLLDDPALDWLAS